MTGLKVMITFTMAVIVSPIIVVTILVVMGVRMGIAMGNDLGGWLRTEDGDWIG